MKKQFVTPRVLQQVQVCLEKDLLQGPSLKDNTTAVIEGHETVVHDSSYFEESDWE